MSAVQTGVSAAVSAVFRKVLVTEVGSILMPTSRLVDASLSRDALNTDHTSVLRAGMLLGKITASGLLAPSILGVTGEAMTQLTETDLTVAEKVGDYIVSRIGSSGTFKIVGPPTAAGTVRALTCTYSAVAAASGGNRVITVTALGANEVQTVSFAAAATGGSVQLEFVHPVTGVRIRTNTAAWSGTDATFLSNINTALDAALGSGAVVATAIAATDTDLGFVLTFSGGAFAGVANEAVRVVTHPTSVTYSTVTRTTAGYSGDFVTGSLIMPSDGSETPIGIIGDGYGFPTQDSGGNDVDTGIDNLLIGGIIDPTKIVNWPADTSLRTYLKSLLNATSHCQFTYSDAF